MRTGGRGGRDADPPPEPDCPSYDPYCQPCRSATPPECPPGRWCDVFRNYCAPYCGMGFDCPFDLPACDMARSVCVECTYPGHCEVGFTCASEKCVPERPPECFNNTQCDNPDKPVCLGNRCQPCTTNAQCEPKHCAFGGRCEDGSGM